MSGRDLMCCSPTGSGKTAAFLLPILHKLIGVGADRHAEEEIQTPQCVIITPTGVQGKQIAVEAEMLAEGSVIKCVSAYHNINSNYQIRQLQKGCNILICTPERMLDLMDEGILSFRNVKYLVMDEADRMLDLPDVLECIRNNLPTEGDVPDEMQLTAQELLFILFATVGVVSRAVEEEEVVDAIGFNDLLENTDEAQTEGENRKRRNEEAGTSHDQQFQSNDDLEDIKSSMRVHFIENIQAANGKLVAKEKEFKGNEDNRKREEKEMKERQDSDMRKIDFKFESDINKLEENKKEQEQKLAMIKTNLAEMKQKKKTAQEAAVKSQRDELHMLNARQTQDKRDEKNTLTNLKKMSDQLSRNLDDLDLQPANEEPPRKKAKLEAARATLECPVCLEDMKPPTKIWMCTASHIVCGPCKARLAGMACPTCRVKGITLRAHMAEKFARSVFDN